MMYCFWLTCSWLGIRKHTGLAKVVKRRELKSDAIATKIAFQL
jgi:hypothetical protein